MPHSCILVNLDWPQPRSACQQRLLGSLRMSVSCFTDSVPASANSTATNHTVVLLCQVARSIWAGAGIFSRACTALCGQKGNRESVLAEATALKESLVDKLASLRSSQGGNARSSGIGQPALPKHAC